ncbi:hypothetical protein F4801DRAFT_581306 [Xylaria longipes]|nr:hypothetical protein F4801DRAFT_581306 [Xylaria longipes]
MGTQWLESEYQWLRAIVYQILLRPKIGLGKALYCCTMIKTSQLGSSGLITLMFLCLAIVTPAGFMAM